MTQDNPGIPGGYAPGSRIAGYLLEEQIGQGGMAVVFRAHDERLDRMVALKILAPALAADEAFRQRFIRESRAAAAVDDPHIIPVYEAGESGGVLFIAMRYVRGGDVRSMLSTLGPMPPFRVAEIISQVAGALDAAHGRGLVHRDVKPANMLLDARPGSGGGRPDHVYLSDFGLSKASLQATGLTGTGMFLGTLDYIAPEQIEGRPVDGRADQYALACAAYELITGGPPFVRNDAMAVMYAQLTEAPPPVTSRRPDVPAAIDGVFARAMAKPADQRYATCSDFADALRDALGIRPYDSGANPVPPTPPHPMTQVVGSGPGRGGPGGTGPGGPAGGRPDLTAGATAPRDPAAGGPPTQYAGGGGRSTTPDESPDLTAAHWQSVHGKAPYASQDGSGYRRRPWWRSPGAIAAAIVLLVILAGGGGYLGLHHSKKDAGHTVALTLPGCTTTAAKGKQLKVPSSRVSLSRGNPFGVLTSPDGKFVFAVTPTALEVLKKGHGLSLTPAFSYTITTDTMQATGAAMTHDGKYILVAQGSGLQVLSVTNAEAGASSISVGTLSAPTVSGNGQAVDVAIGKQDKFAFVTLKAANVLAVFDVRKALQTGSFGSSDFVGSVKLGSQPVGLDISPDNHKLYVASFGKNNSSGQGQGLLTVLNVQKAEVNPTKAILAQGDAGCEPARVTTSGDGKTVWVTARGSNTLLGFDASKLLSSGTRDALIAKVPVGQTPIGLALVDGGSRMVIADTDADKSGKNADNLAIVNVSAALAGEPALKGYIPSGELPREMTVVPGGRYLLVSDNGSAQIQVVDLSKLP